MIKNLFPIYATIILLMMTMWGCSNKLERLSLPVKYNNNVKETVVLKGVRFQDKVRFQAVDPKNKKDFITLNLKQSESVTNSKQYDRIWVDKFWEAFVENQNPAMLDFGPVFPPPPLPPPCECPTRTEVFLYKDIKSESNYWGLLEGNFYSKTEGPFLNGWGVKSTWTFEKGGRLVLEHEMVPMVNR